MVWCCQTTSHYLSQSLLSYGVPNARWMNYVPRKMPDVRSRYARFTIAPTYVRMLRYMDECYGLFTTKTNHFLLERHKLRQMVTNRDVLSVLLFVTIFHYSLENMSKFPRLYDVQFVGEIEDSINTTDTPYKMHGDNWYNFMTYKTCHTMFFLPYIPKKCIWIAFCIITRAKNCISGIS